VSSRISDVSLKLALASLVIPGVGEGVAGTLITISGWAEIAGASASTLKFFITLSVEDRQTFVIDVSAVAISKYIERKLKLNPKLSERVKLALIALISASVNKTKGVVTMILNEKKNEKYEKDESNDRYVAPADNTRVDWWWQGWGAQYQGSPR
ncbi:MAG: hypothetical protein ACE5GL_04010, partial [Calditrichia bacterium]